ncbi:MAG TPA: S-layer homology domain-containing protein, partial [Acidimicrobiia bacterium]|nr:S-layer homology domain-containing protein [Acidimicrobiia bacterium]
INSLAAQGILRGCNPPANTRVCPEAFITRAEAAAMVRRLLGLPKGPDAFEDDRGSWAEGDINALAAAGISRGCNPPANTRYCPERSISRDEAATFTLRIDNLLSELTTLAAPDLPEWPPLGPPPEKPPEEQE